MNPKTIVFFVLLVASSNAKACPSLFGLLDLNCDGVIRVATFGDSITRGIGDSTGLGYPGRLAALLPGVEIYNFGSPGEFTRVGRQRAVSVFNGSIQFDYTIVLEGVNDYFDDTRSAQETRLNLRAILFSVDTHSQTSLLSKLTPVRRDFQKDWVNSVNTAIANETQVDFFSLGTSIISSDLLHPDGEGYQKMTTRAYLSLVNTSNTLLNQDPQKFIDSDNDGIWDSGESLYGTNPLLVDSDFDGISDNSEVFVYNSNPLATDSDGDGLTDFQEIVVYQTNPNSRVPGAPAITEFKFATPFELR